MLNSQTALSYIERIEKARADHETYESGILNSLRAEPGYEANQDKDLLEAIRLRAEARTCNADADSIIGSFDWTYDEERGENVRKSS